MFRTYRRWQSTYRTGITTLFTSLFILVIAPLATGTASAKTLNNSWYTMQANNTPWGYFHELIEETEEKMNGKPVIRYHYHYEMTRREGDSLYRESTGAIAESDLTPVTFNLSKSGTGATEMVDGTYIKDAPEGHMRVTTQGARNLEVTRAFEKGAILEDFFPVWVRQNWDKIKPGARGSLHIFAEDPADNQYALRTATYKVQSVDLDQGCTRLSLTLYEITSEWCLTKDGVTKYILFTGNSGGPNVQVRQAKNEKEAKAFLGPVKKQE